MNETTIFLGSILLTTAIGFIIGLFTRGVKWIFISLFLILITSNFWQSIPGVNENFKQWHSLYMGGLAQTGIFSVFFHTLPAWIGFSIARRLQYKLKISMLILAGLGIISLAIIIVIIKSQ